MRSVFLGAALLVASGLALPAVPAFAADVSEPSAHDWTGFYIGANVGFGKYSVEGGYDYENWEPGDTFVDNGEGPFDLEAADFLGGAQAGFNYQVNQFVLGVEGDFSLMNMSDSVKYASDDDELSTEMGWLATLRARAGVSFDDLLVYGTGGIAMSDASFTANDDYVDNEPGDKGSLDFDGTGFVFGGGVEYAISDSWSLRGEALYVIFNDDQSAEGINDDETDPRDHVELQDMLVGRFGVNFAF